VQNRLLFALPVVPLLLAAAFWNPAEDFTKYDSSRWIGSGLEHERLGDFKAAERDLLEAAQIDRLYQPRWTLAGFYFRRNDPDNFWRWTREALAVGARDLGALFDLCWKMPDGSDKIWTIAMPHSKTTWDEYLYYLTSTKKWPAAATTAERIALVAEASDKPLLTGYCDLALEHKDKAGARAVWQAMRKRELLPFAADSLLTNGDFRSVPSGRGFDWRPLPQGLANSFHPGEASFTFNGFEHEREALLEQPLALDPKLKYELKFEYKTATLAANSGIHWVVGTAASIDLSASEWAVGQLEFSGTAPSLALIYQRRLGSTVADGKLSIKNVSVIPR
jgi:hypothetical protein